MGVGSMPKGLAVAVGPSKEDRMLQLATDNRQFMGGIFRRLWELENQELSGVVTSEGDVTATKPSTPGSEVIS